jgi:hypothetical protein
MQPVGMIREAVEIVRGRHPRQLVTTQAQTIRGKVPLQCHRADRQMPTLPNLLPAGYVQVWGLGT